MGARILVSLPLALITSLAGSFGSLSHFLLFGLLLGDHLALLHILLLPFLLQVRDGEQTNYGYGRRRWKGESRRDLGFRGLLGRRPFIPPSHEAPQAFPQI